MICPECRTNTSIHAKFCGKCRTQLQKTCPECKVLAPMDSTYCTGCGEDLSYTYQDSIEDIKMINLYNHIDMTYEQREKLIADYWRTEGGPGNPRKKS